MRELLTILALMRIRAILKWLAIAAGVVTGLAMIAVTTVYVTIGLDLDRNFDVEGKRIEIPDDGASVAEGARLARLRGCNGGCHGEAVNGEIFFDAPDGTRVVAPDLARSARKLSVEELERVIRRGVRPDGTSVLFVMPSEMFYRLSDHDLGAIIAYLKSQKPGKKALPSTWLGPLARLLLFDYKRTTGTILAAEYVDAGDSGDTGTGHDEYGEGRYLAFTVCTECHGKDLGGGPDGFAPTLAIAAAYSPDDFRKLMREGTPVGDRQLELMAEVAKSRFRHFTDAEIGSLYEFLKTLAAGAPPP